MRRKKRCGGSSAQVAPACENHDLIEKGEQGARAAGIKREREGTPAGWTPQWGMRAGFPPCAKITTRLPAWQMSTIWWNYGR